MALGAITLVEDLGKQTLAYLGIWHEFSVSAHPLLVGASEAALYIVKNIAEEGRRLDAVLEALIGITTLGFECVEGAADAIPTGHVKARLVPAEDPWDCAKVVEGGLPGAA